MQTKLDKYTINISLEEYKINIRMDKYKINIKLDKYEIIIKLDKYKINVRMDKYKINLKLDKYKINIRNRNITSRLHLMLIRKKKRTCHQVDFAIPANHRMKIKENEKMNK